MPKAALIPGGVFSVMWLILGAVVPAFLVSCLATAGVRRFAPRCGLVDRPGHRKVHAASTPLGGGIGIWLGVLVPLAGVQAVAWSIAPPHAEQRSTADQGSTARAASPTWLPQIVRDHAAGIRQQLPKLGLLAACSTVLVVLGLADDRRGLRWQVRLAIETLVAWVVVAAGFRLTFYIAVPWLTAALSVLWIVALINSFNMLDNMDGLSGGVAAIAGAILAAVVLVSSQKANIEPQLFVAGFLLVFVGAVLGFLWHNRPPARIFMGDSGSYFIGFWLAVSTMMVTYTPGDLPSHAVLAPLCVLAVPLYDMTSVIFIRLREGRSPFEGDKSHFSHRLVELGMTKTQAVLTIYLATATCGLGALLLHQVDAVGASVVLSIVLCVLALVAVLETVGRRSRAK